MCDNDLVPFSEWTSADDNQKLQLQACNNQCTKIVSGYV